MRHKRNKKKSFDTQMIIFVAFAAQSIDGEIHRNEPRLQIVHFFDGSCVAEAIEWRFFKLKKKKKYRKEFVSSVERQFSVRSPIVLFVAMQI